MNHKLLLGGAALALAGGFTGQALAAGPIAVAGAQAAAAATSNNVLLADWVGPYEGVPPWDKVKPEQFDQAFTVAIAEVEREAAAIANNPEPPTWANTIEAMEKSGQKIDQVGSVFAVMTDNMSTPAYQALDKTWSPKLSAVFDKITLDPKLFARIETLYNNRASLGLDAKQTRLLTRTYDSFVRRGAKLDSRAEGEGHRDQPGAVERFYRVQLAPAGRRGHLHPGDRRRNGRRSPGNPRCRGRAGQGKRPSRRHVRDPQHPLGGRAGAELRHQPRASREGVQGVRQSRRQRQCQ